MTGILAVFIGAGLGGIMRYLLSSTIASQSFAQGFPLGTFVVNMIGCLAIGFLAQLSESRVVVSPEVRLFIFVGILGGFTTFSSFGYETMQLLRDGQLLPALVNALGQVALGLFCVWLGILLGRLAS